MLIVTTEQYELGGRSVNHPTVLASNTHGYIFTVISWPIWWYKPTVNDYCVHYNDFGFYYCIQLLNFFDIIEIQICFKLSEYVLTAF